MKTSILRKKNSLFFTAIFMFLFSVNLFSECPSIAQVNAILNSADIEFGGEIVVDGHTWSLNINNLEILVQGPYRVSQPTYLPATEICRYEIESEAGENAGWARFVRVD